MIHDKNSEGEGSNEKVDDSDKDPNFVLLIEEEEEETRGHWTLMIVIRFLKMKPLNTMKMSSHKHQNYPIIFFDTWKKKEL